MFSEQIAPGSGARRRRRAVTGEEEATAVECDVAERLKAAYTQHMTLYLSQRDGVARSYTPPNCWDAHVRDPDYPEDDKTRPSTWLKVARGMIARGYDPAVYVRRQFETFRKSGPPFLTLFLTPVCEKAYQAGAETELKNERFVFTAMVELAASRITQLTRSAGESPIDAWQLVIGDSGLNLSPLFRYGMARAIEKQLTSDRPREAEIFGKIAREHFESAAREYARRLDVITQTWDAGFLPDDFRGKALELYGPMYGRARRA